MKTIYVVDCTSRQYSFPLTETPITLTFQGQTHFLTSDEPKMELLHHVIEENVTFTLSSNNLTMVFNPGNLVGVQLYKPE